MPNFETYRSWRRPDPIEGILIHHSGSGTVDMNGVPNKTPQAIAESQVRDEGRAHVGYHYAIAADGTVYYLLDDAIPGYHTALPEPSRADQTVWKRWRDNWLNGQYFNRRTLGVLLLGWFDSNRKEGTRALPNNNMTPPAAQSAALVELLRTLKERHSLSIERIEGHREVLARTGFGSTSCPGLLMNLHEVRTAVQSGQSVQPTPVTPPVVSGPVVVPGPAPALTYTKNRPLVGLHARNDQTFTDTDWTIIREAKVESLKMMSFTRDEVYAQARQINPKMEFIVRLYIGGSGRGHVPAPQVFADAFRDTMDRLYKQFGVLKFEIHNEPNHLSGLEGWGQEQADAISFQTWYIETFRILRQRHPWALLGYPGLAVPHKDLEWLEWNRQAIEMSDFLGCHIYWQTPPGNETTYLSDFWGLRFKSYHEKYPHKLIEITEFGNSNGQSPPLSLSREEQKQQYQTWLQKVMGFPYIGSAHGFIATSPDSTWSNQGFTWGDGSGSFPVTTAVGSMARAKQRPDWHYVFNAKVPDQLPPDVELTFPVTLGNGGRLPWPNAGNQRVIAIAKWVDETGAVREKPVSSVLLPHEMAPGDRTEFTIKVRTPTESGKYRLRLALFHNGFGQWLHTLDPATTPDLFPVAIGGAKKELSPLAATYSPVTLPKKGLAGDTLKATLTARNDGSRRWESKGEQQGSIRLGYHWVNAQGQRAEGKGRVTLSAPIATGESSRLEIPLELPTTAGQYTLQLGLVSELEQWFDSPLQQAVEVEALGAAYSVTYKATLPTKMKVGEKKEVAVRIMNNGTRRWEAAGQPPIMLVHQWLDAQGQVAQPTLRTVLSVDVRPGKSLEVLLPLLAPAIPGPYTLRVDLSREGQFFFSQQGNPALTQSIVVEAVAGAAAWGAEWLDIRGPTTMSANSAGRMDVRLRNSGQRLWSHTNVRVAYRWSSDAMTRRVPLTADVPPGGEIALGISLVAPKEVGVHTLDMDLWEEGKGWLRVAAPLRQITVTAADPGGSAPTRTLENEEESVSKEDSAPGSNGSQGGRVATASHHLSRARFAIDSNKISTWNSGDLQQPGMWYQIELGAAQTFQTLRFLSGPGEFPRGYRLEGSLDAETWALIDEAADNWADVDLALATPYTCRYLRLTLTKRSPWHEWSIRHVLIDGK